MDGTQTRGIHVLKAGRMRQHRRRRRHEIGCCGFAVAAIDWEGISPDKKAKIERSASAVAARIRHRSGKVKPGFKTKALFSIMRLFQKKFGYNPKDTEYWTEKGWLDKKRPWKRL